MGKISKAIALSLTLTIIMSCLTMLMTKPALANPMDYTPPKPSIPEFTLNYADSSYDLAGNFVQNKSIDITITNQPSAYVLCYNVRLKSHLSTNWTYYEYYDNSSYLTPELFIPNRLLAWNSTVTHLVFGFEGNNGSDVYNLMLGEVNGGNEVDFQVQAYIGNWFPGRLVNATATIDYYLLNIDATGDWSPTQTITIPESNTLSPSPTFPSASPTPTPTVPELSWLATVPLLIGMLSVAVIVRKRKQI
jgi:hypothetical protein